MLLLLDFSGADFRAAASCLPWLCSSSSSSISSTSCAGCCGLFQLESGPRLVGSLQLVPPCVHYTTVQGSVPGQLPAALLFYHPALIRHSTHLTRRLAGTRIVRPAAGSQHVPPFLCGLVEWCFWPPFAVPPHAQTPSGRAGECTASVRSTPLCGLVLSSAL
jgi:hypothetical protein